MHKVENLDNLKISLNFPIGNFFFRISTEELRLNEIDIEIFNVITKGHIFLLKYVGNETFQFIHSSESSGTWISEVRANELSLSKEISFGLIWANNKCSLFVELDRKKDKSFFSEGTKQKFHYRIFKNGILKIGDDNIKVDEVRINYGGEILEPNAKESWENIKEAVEILVDGFEKRNFQHEIIQSNITLTTIITGFEQYNKKRPIELYNEGINCDLQKLRKRILSKNENELLEKELISFEDQNDKDDLIFKFLLKRINFQNFKDCNDFFKFGFNISFYEIKIPQNTIEEIRKIIEYRHRIVHVSPLLTILNFDEPGKRPIFNSINFVKESLNKMDCLIQAIHEQTLTKGND